MFRIKIIILLFFSLFISGVVAEEKTPVMLKDVKKFYNDSPTTEEESKPKILESLSSEELPINKAHPPKPDISKVATDGKKEPSLHEKKSQQFQEEMLKPQQAITNGINAQRVKKGQAPLVDIKPFQIINTPL